MCVQVILKNLIFMTVFGAFTFLAAGTLRWTMGWAYLILNTIILISGCLIIPGGYLAEERMHVKEERESGGNIDLILSGGNVVAALVAALDLRFHWSGGLSTGYQVAALIMASLGSILSIWAMASNRFFSRFVRIRQERSHAVSTNGPYRYVRHPGYAGGILSFLGTPLALGSWWALLPGSFPALLTIVRTALEDWTLKEELPGYDYYAYRIRYRLLPGVW